MDDKTYIVLNSKMDTVEFTIHVPADEDVYVLKRSSSETWSSHVREETVLTILDSGDGFRIKWEEQPKGKMLDYTQVVALTIMLNFVNQVSRIPENYKIVDVDEISNVL